MKQIEAPYWERRHASAPQQGEINGRGYPDLTCPRCERMTLYRTEWDEPEETVDECGACGYWSAYPTE